MSKVKEAKFICICREDKDDPHLIEAVLAINPRPPSAPFDMTSNISDIGYFIQTGFRPGDIVEVVVRKVGNDPSIS